jgi:hypothetical protein
MSYWLDSTTKFPRLKGDVHTDVAVIGAGITGGSVCYWLGAKCKSVLLESDTVASKASGRNAGFLLTGTSDYYNKAIKRYGPRKARKIWKLTQENHTLLEKHISKNSIECGYNRSGSYLVASSNKEMEDITESVSLLKRDGFNYKLMGKKEINKVLSSSSFHGAAFNAFDGEVNPVKLVSGLVKMASNNSTHVFENTRVTKIERKNELFILKTRTGTVTADYVVLATNAYTPLICPYFLDVIKPVRGQVLLTEPHKEKLSGVFYANYGYEYWRQLPSGRILAGGCRDVDPATETGYSMITTKKIQNKLEDLLHKLHIGSKVAYRWSGIMGFTKDQLPIIGSVPGMEKLLISAGYSGHGLGFSFIAGRMIGEKILHSRDPVSFFGVRDYSH